MNEVISNLLVEVDSVGNHDKTGLFNWAVLFHAFTKNNLCEHNHRNCFSTALCMPHNAVSCVGTVFQ